MTSGRGWSVGSRGRGSGGVDPLACYRCGVRGHLARDCPGTSSQLLTLSGGNPGPACGSSCKSGQSGPRCGNGRKRQARFGGMGVVYDNKGYEYPVDEYGQLYVPLYPKKTIAEEVQVEKKKDTKN